MPLLLRRLSSLLPIRRREAPSDRVPVTPPVLLDAWSGAEIGLGSRVPEPFGDGHVVVLGRHRCACGTAGRDLRVFHPRQAAHRVYSPEDLGVRWSHGHAVDPHPRADCRKAAPQQ